MPTLHSDPIADAYGDLWSWFKHLFRVYRIRYVEGFGYIPEVFTLSVGWCVIEPSGTVGEHTSGGVPYFRYEICDTEEQAGERINRHAARRGRVVWKG